MTCALHARLCNGRDAAEIKTGRYAPFCSRREYFGKVTLRRVGDYHKSTNICLPCAALNCVIASGRENVPFETHMKRDIHFQKHGNQFGAADAAAYEQMADEFMFGVLGQNTRQCRRPNQGSRLRFDTWNRRFGSASVMPEFVQTFYIVAQGHIDYHGGEVTYFGWECGRINV